MRSNVYRNCPLHGRIVEELSSLALVTATNVLSTPQQAPGHQYKARDRAQRPEIGLRHKYQDILTVRRFYLNNPSRFTVLRVYGWSDRNGACSFD